MMWVSKKDYARLVERVVRLESGMRALEFETGLWTDGGGYGSLKTSSQLEALRQDFEALVKSFELQRKVTPAGKAKVEYIRALLPKGS